MGFSWVHSQIRALASSPLCSLSASCYTRPWNIESQKKLNQRKKIAYICYMTPTCINPLPYCMHYVTCVKGIQEFLVFHSCLSFKAGSYHGTGSVDTVVWHNYIFRCRHWRRDCHRGSSGFSVFLHLFMFKPNSCRVSSYIVLNISRGIYSPRNSEETRHGSPVRAGYGVFCELLD